MNENSDALTGWAKRKRVVREAMPWIAAFFGLGAVAALIVVQLFNNGGKANTTTLGLLAVGLILLFTVAAPYHASEAVRRVSKLKLGALELGLKEIKRAERVRPVPGEGDGVPAPRSPDCGYRQIVAELQGRLRFVRLILEFENEVKEEDYRGIASWLRGHELLRQDEEAFVLDLLEGSGADLPEWDAVTRADFLDAAYAFSVRFGPKIWDRWVRHEIRRDEWFVVDYKQGPGHRPDFLAYREGRWALMTARVVGARPDYLEVAAPRLLDFEPRTLIASRAIVIPDIRAGKVAEECAWGPGRPDGVRVLKLGDLKKDTELAFAEPKAEAPAVRAQVGSRFET